MKTLLISRDPEILNIVSLTFGLDTPQALLIHSEAGPRGAELVETERPDLILLDVQLTDTDGFEVLRQIRSFSNTPLIVVTARGEEMARVRGLELGADDYVVKPFSPLELLARARAVLRRSTMDDLTLPVNLDHGRVVIDFQSQEVLLQGQEVRLTPTEYRLLCQLATNLGKTVSQKALIEKVWGEEYLEAPNVLKVHIHRLRRKLEDDPNNPQFIVTIPRRGYKFKITASAERSTSATAIPAKPAS